MPAPPLKTAISGTPTRATANTGFGALYDYVTGLLGATGTPAAARAALGAYGKDSVLGTVSQSGGVPTGAIIERGSNANGEYVRFADGTQICTHTLPSFTAAANASTNALWTYPSAFTVAPMMPTWNGVPQVSGDVYGFVYAQGVGVGGAAMAFRNGGTAQIIANSAVAAIGRWF